MGVAGVAHCSEGRLSGEVKAGVLALNKQQLEKYYFDRIGGLQDLLSHRNSRGIQTAPFAAPLVARVKGTLVQLVQLLQLSPHSINIDMSNTHSIHSCTTARSWTATISGWDSG